MIRKLPVGILGWTDEERAEHGRTGKWPERKVEVPDSPPGLSLGGFNVPDQPPPSTEAAAGRQSIREALRTAWIASVMPDARREALAEFSSKGGRAETRKSRPWHKPAVELAKVACSKNPNASNSRIASEIEDGLNAQNVKGRPEHRQLETFVSKLRKTGVIPKKA
jgi:hypothetical protein